MTYGKRIKRGNMQYSDHQFNSDERLAQIIQYSYVVMFRRPSGTKDKKTPLVFWSIMSRIFGGGSSNTDLRIGWTLNNSSYKWKKMSFYGKVSHLSVKDGLNSVSIQKRDCNQVYGLSWQFQPDDTANKKNKSVKWGRVSGMCSVTWSPDCVLYLAADTWDSLEIELKVQEKLKNERMKTIWPRKHSRTVILNVKHIYDHRLSNKLFCSTALTLQC